MKGENQFETIPYLNEFTAAYEKLNANISVVAGLLGKIHAAQEKTRMRETKFVYPGNTVSMNFSVQSIYVDNSQNTSPVTFTLTSGITFIVAANKQAWIHPLGGREFEMTGGNMRVPCLFVDDYIPV